MIKVHRAQYKSRIRSLCANFLRRFNTIHYGHGKIQHDYVRGQFADFFYGVLPVNSFSANFPTFVLAEQEPDATAYDFVIICYQNSCHFFTSTWDRNTRELL